MSNFKESLRQELLAMREEDERVRAELAGTGELFDGYHPKMEAVHLKHATELEKLIKEHGWLGKSIVGEDGAEAAWLIAQHAISLPEFSRRVLKIMQQEAEKGEVPLWQTAYLEDRINFFEGKPQRYGSQFDWNERGEMQPHQLLETDKIDERRRAVGLSVPYSEVVQEQIEAAKQLNEPFPPNFEKRQRKFEEWTRKVGWRA